MNDKNYHVDDYYNDKEIDNYYGNNQDYYYPNYNNYNNPQYPHVEPKPKKSKGIITGIAIGILAGASLTGIGVGVYYLIGQSDNNINSIFVSNAELSQTGQYIAERSLSLQFVFDNSANKKTYIASCGTGWIINKEKNSDIYYIATNLHVAAILTYENQSIWTYEASEGDSDSVTNYGRLDQCLVGYITNYNYQNNTYKFSTITVPKPTIVYTTAMDSSWSNLEYGTAKGLSYPSYASSSTSGNTNYYSLESDFAILRYDFTNLTKALAVDVDTGVDQTPNSSADVKNFESWLSTYNNSPTEFLPQAQALTYKTTTNDWEKWKFAMGGFPASTNSSSSDSSDNNPLGSINKNYSNVVWKEFVGFTAYSYTGIYYSRGGIGSPGNVQNSNEDASPIVYYGTGNNISYTSADPWDGGYVNGAYGARLGASSDPGSSGSMLITQINNQFYVVGIYWGETSWDNDSSVYGAADLLNISGQYNLFSWSYNYLTNNGASLYINPTTNQINN